MSCGLFHLIYNPSPTPLASHAGVFKGGMKNELPSKRLRGRLPPPTSPYFITGRREGVVSLMKWNCPVGSIVDPVDLVDLLDPVALYRCFT